MAVRFQNPIIEKGADPFVTLFEGKYYYVYSLADASLQVSVADSINLLNRDGKTVFTPPAGTEYSKELWAPEIHYIDGDWYIYVAADNGKNVNHRMYVLRSKDKTPDGEYEMIGKITSPDDHWAIDGTVIHHEGKLYFVWSGWEGDENVAQNIYIAKMKSPTEIEGERVLISKPEYEWEKRHCGVCEWDGKFRPYINEGPQILYKDNTIHVVYSASGSWSRYYCLGILTFRGGDIMDASNWIKKPELVFEESEGAHGTGHCSFTTSPSGKTDIIVYHAMRTPNGGWGARGVRAQPFTWDGDMPVFGKAAGLDEWIEIPD